MSSEMFYFIVMGIAAVLFVAAILHIRYINGYRMYDFRNVIIAAICPFSCLLVVSLLTEFGGRKQFSLLSFLLNYPARFANLSIAVIALLGVAMAVSNISLIRHEGMALKNTVGTILQLIWIIATIIVYVMVCIMKAYADNVSGLLSFLFFWIPFFLYCLIDYGECIMVGMMIMGWVAAHGKSAYDKDFIIIPGCSISKNGGLLPLLRGRVNRAIRYAWEQEIATGKPVHYIPSGGKGADEIMSEGSAMELYLLSHSAENYEVMAEKESKNTEENFLFSARIINDHNPDAHVAFATTNYHVLRCGMLAKRAGLTAEGLASDTKWYFWPNGFAREVAAIFAMTRRYHLIAVVILFAVSLFLSYIGAGAA